MKRCSVSLKIKDMQLKPHPEDWQTFQSFLASFLERLQRNKYSYLFLIRVCIYVVFLEGSLAGSIPGAYCNCWCAKQHMSIFTVALCVTTEVWRRCRCLRIENRLHRVLFFHAMEYYAALKQSDAILDTNLVKTS